MSDRMKAFRDGLGVTAPSPQDDSPAKPDDNGFAGFKAKPIDGKPAPKVPSSKKMTW
jgi:hypothetical protein